MLRAVSSFNETVPVSIQGMMPGYDALIIELADKNVQIGTLSGNQGLSLKGYQEKKSETKKILVTKVMTIVYATKAFAIAEQNNVLLAQTKAIAKTKLLKMRDSKTADTAEEMITIATGIQTDLNPYGITIPVLEQTTELLTTFRTELAIPRNKIAVRKLVTAQINTLFKEAAATDIRSKGINNIFVGIGLFIFLWAITGEFGLGCIGLLVMFTGFGQLVIFYSQQKKNEEK